MAYVTVRDLPKLIAQSTGTGSVTQGIGNLDDANSITIYFQSTGGWAVGAVGLQVAQFDPSLLTSALSVGAVQSTVWNSSTSLFTLTSSNQAVTITPIAFRGIRLTGTSSSATAEVVAFVSKTVSV